MKSTSIGRVAVRACVWASALCWAPPASAQEAEWIWVTREATDGQAGDFVRHFDLGDLGDLDGPGGEGAEITRATLVASCDNRLVVHVNGVEVMRSDRWEAPVSVDVSAHLLAGRMDVLVDPYSLRVESVEPGEIARVEPSPVSPMPPGLVDTLTAAELADLLAYLESGAGR